MSSTIQFESKHNPGPQVTYILKVWLGCGLSISHGLSKWLNIVIRKIIDDFSVNYPHSYTVKAEDISSQIDKTECWKRKANKLPKCANESALSYLSLALSSASERVFLFCQSLFPIGTKRSLRDYIQTSAMIQNQYNSRCSQ